jgi:hypothetical protein
MPGHPVLAFVFGAASRFAIDAIPHYLGVHWARCCRIPCKYCTSYIRGNRLDRYSDFTVGCTQNEG